MVVTVEHIRFVGCRTVKQEDGSDRTYGNIYTDNGELLPFVADFEVRDTLEETSAQLDIAWGTGKYGKWIRAQLF